MTETLEDLKRHIGNSATARDVVTASQIGRLAAALGVAHPAPDEGDAVPPGWHAVFFPTLAPLGALREDGQPAGGGVAPPVPLPRRRIVAVRGSFHDALRVGDPIERVTELADIRIEDFGAGPTVTTTTVERISSPRGLAATDERDFLAFGDGGPGDAAAPPAVPESAAWTRTYEPDPVMVFRLSAVRFNGHRIHYDRDYATRVEGYAGIVVPVTLVTFLMMELCRAEAPDRPLTAFSYRSLEPVCDLGPYSIYGQPEDGRATLWARDHAGDLAVTAQAVLGGVGWSVARPGRAAGRAAVLSALHKRAHSHRHPRARHEGPMPLPRRWFHGLRGPPVMGVLAMYRPKPLTRWQWMLVSSTSMTTGVNGKGDDCRSWPGCRLGGSRGWFGKGQRQADRLCLLPEPPSLREVDRGPRGIRPHRRGDGVMDSDTMDIKAIETERDYDRALAEIERLMLADPAPGSADAARLEVLAVLVSAYEDRHHPIDPPDPIEAIRFVMDQKA